MQKIRCRMPAAKACSSGGSSQEFELQKDVAYGLRSSVEINPTFPSPIRTSHSKRRGPSRFRFLLACTTPTRSTPVHYVFRPIQRTRGSRTPRRGQRGLSRQHRDKSSTEDQKREQSVGQGGHKRWRDYSWRQFQVRPLVKR